MRRTEIGFPTQAMEAPWGFADNQSRVIRETRYLPLFCLRSAPATGDTSKRPGRVNNNMLMPGANSPWL